MRPKKSTTLIKNRQSLLKNSSNNPKISNNLSIIKKDNINTNNFRSTIKNNQILTNKSTVTRVYPNLSQKMKNFTQKKQHSIRTQLNKNNQIKIQNKNQLIKKLNPEESIIKRTNFRTTKYSNQKKNNQKDNCQFNTRKSKLQTDKQKGNKSRIQQSRIIEEKKQKNYQSKMQRQPEIQNQSSLASNNIQQVQIQIQQPRIKQNSNIVQYENAIRSQMAEQLGSQPIVQIQPQVFISPIIQQHRQNINSVIEAQNLVLSNLDLSHLINNTQDIISFINRLGLRNQHPTFGMMIDQMNQLNAIAQQVHELGSIGDRLGYSLVNVFGSRIRQLQTTIINQVGQALIASFQQRMQPQFQALVLRQPSLRNGFNYNDIEKTFKQKIAFQQIECSICLDYLKPGQLNIQLQCNHSYHPICIRTWLQNSKKCPYCRKEQKRKE